MADDFQVKITADLDTSEAEQKLNNLINDKNKLKIDVELNQNSAKKLSSDIEKGVNVSDFMRCHKIAHIS